jgi:diguanylate cyclase (GGDEF)-like protein
MVKHHDKSGEAIPSGVPEASRGEVSLLLCTNDAALLRAWEEAAPPQGFRLETSPELRPEHLSGPDPLLALVPAETALAATGLLGDALATRAGRCVWTGTAEAIDRLGPARIDAAYDILITPTTPSTLSRRLAGWERSIRRTAALEIMGRRVEELAQQNSRLATRGSETEAALESLQRQRERLDLALRKIHQVARLSREINSLDLDTIVSVSIEQLPPLVEAQRASLYLYDAAGDRLILQGHSHDRPIAKRIDLQDNPRSPMALAVRRGELLLIGEFREFEQETDTPLEREFRDQYATSSCIIVPLKGGGRVRGVLNLADKEDGSRFDAEIDLPVVEQIAELIGASIYNVELYQEMERRAKTDALTNLANRRTVEETLVREHDRSRRYGTDLTILMIDVDQLKEVNDRLGHNAGDAVLRNLARILVETVRSVDLPGRWAGDEFVVVLPDTSATQAELLGRRLMAFVRDQPVTVDGRPVAASVSIGVAQEQKDESVESLIHRVDQAMYSAKHGGRNRITTAEPPEKGST